MPRRSILSATERDTLLALPESQDDLIRYYTFNESDLSLIRQRRGDANRLGFAVQICLLRYPGYALASDSVLPDPVIEWVATQVQAATRRVGRSTASARRPAANTSMSCAPTWACRRSGCRTSATWCASWPTWPSRPTKACCWPGRLWRVCVSKRRILPALTVIERACAEAVARANRRIYRALIEPLSQTRIATSSTNC